MRYTLSPTMKGSDMRTSIEALFESMVNDGWFTATDGNVESPTGHFAYVTNTVDEVASILDAFAESVDTYGVPATDDIVGSFVVVTDDQGFIAIHRYANDRDARSAFQSLQGVFTEWSNR